MKKALNTILVNLFEDSSPERIKRARLVIAKHPGATQEVKDQYLNAIDEIVDGLEDKTTKAPKDTTEVPVNLVDALKAEGMDEYIQSIRDEYLEKGKAAAKDTAGAEKGAEEGKGAAHSAEDADKDIRKLLIDSIVQDATILHKKEIDLDAIDASQETYRKELEDKSTEDLRKIFADLSKDKTTKLVETPTAMIDKTTVSVDNPDGESDEGTQKQAMTDADKMVESFRRSIT